MIKEQTRLGNYIFSLSLYKATMRFKKNGCLKLTVLMVTQLLFEDDIPNEKLRNIRRV